MRFTGASKMAVPGWVVLVLTFTQTLAAYDRLYAVAYEDHFHQWMSKHGKRYQSRDEYIKRLEVFIDSYSTILKHNSGNHTFKMGLNEYSDLSWDEFKARIYTKSQDCSATHKVGNHKMVQAAKDLPKFVDWRDKQVVSPVKNQGSCGSCWTFSTTGAMEAHMSISYGGMYNLSEQQCVDCAQAFKNNGCHGGLPSQAFEYIHYNPGLMSEEDYPYTAKDGNCRFDKSKAKAFVKDVVNVTQYDEDMLTDAIANKGPVSIAYQVASDFRHYFSGVYSSDVCQKGPETVNHAVLAVGYGETIHGLKYYIVKNSWGTTFGMDGYFWIERGVNECGLSDCASYPVVANAP